LTDPYLAGEAGATLSMSSSVPAAAARSSLPDRFASPVFLNLLGDPLIEGGSRYGIDCELGSGLEKLVSPLAPPALPFCAYARVKERFDGNCGISDSRPLSLIPDTFLELPYLVEPEMKRGFGL